MKPRKDVRRSTPTLPATAAHRPCRLRVIELAALVGTADIVEAEEIETSKISARTLLVRARALSCLAGFRSEVTRIERVLAEI